MAQPLYRTINQASVFVLLTALCLRLRAQSSSDLNAEVAELRALVYRLQARVAELETNFKASAVPESQPSRYPYRHRLRLHLLLRPLS